MNAYEEVIDRLERLRTKRDALAMLVEENETALCEAMIDLAAHESSPGVPLLRYRETPAVGRTWAVPEDLPGYSQILGHAQADDENRLGDPT